MGRDSERGVHIVGCTMLARFQLLVVYDMSVAPDSERAGSTSGAKSSTRTSLWVAVGGSLRITEKKVSWKRTACQSLPVRWLENTDSSRQIRV